MSLRPELKWMRRLQRLAAIGLKAAATTEWKNVTRCRNAGEPIAKRLLQAGPQSPLQSASAFQLDLKLP
jgi:hypothetical protein